MDSDGFDGFSGGGFGLRLGTGLGFWVLTKIYIVSEWIPFKM